MNERCPKHIDQLSKSPAGWTTTPWSVEEDCRFCERSDIDIAILSCIPGGPSLEQDVEKARAFTKACNEYNAQLRDRNPGKYGFFAHVSNPCFPKVALAEIEYALDTLHADGVALATRYESGGKSYDLGHETLIPVRDYLNARSAVVFAHPVPSAETIVVNKNLPPPMYEFPHVTGRAAIDMITGPCNMLRDHAADCKIILSHGGDMPFLIDRAAGLLTSSLEGLRLAKSRGEILQEACRFYFDTALSTSRMHLSALHALLGVQNSDHVLFGSDYPAAGEDAIKQFSSQLPQDDTAGFDLRESAMKLFPRLQRLNSSVA